MNWTPRHDDTFIVPGRYGYIVDAFVFGLAIVTSVFLVLHVAFAIVRGAL